MVFPVSAVIATLGVGIVAVLLALYTQYPTLCGHLNTVCSTFGDSECPSNAKNLHSGYFEYECAGKPHQSSWSAWWHPQRSDVTGKSRKQGAGAITPDWNILYHLGGNGPWVEKTIDVVEGGIGVPSGCVVEQVHLMSRHGERYPTKNAGHNQKAVVKYMRESNNIFNDSLSFFNDWEMFWTDDQSLEQLTTTGPFSGSLGTFSTGVRLRTRYHHLLDKALSQMSGQPIKFWASDSNRVIETAKYFALGFFGLDYSSKNTAALEIISEDRSLGANTLTPGRTCILNKQDKAEGQRKGYRLMGEFRGIYAVPVRARLLAQTGMNFTDQHIYSMQEMCGFETTVRGRSDWCDVFTQEEFLSFEYARDLLHYYRAGPGQKYAASMGWLWLNATTNLMLQGQQAGPLFFSFVHDGDIAPLMAALDVINDEEHLPTTHVRHSRKWRKSQVTPMGGRVIFELLSCNASSHRGEGKFVRLNINDGITAIPGCDSGPGKSCPLKQFAVRTKKRGKTVGNFNEICGLEQGAADRITFLHQQVS